MARPSRWGNPFVVGRDGTRLECVNTYRCMLGGYLCVSRPTVTVADQRAAVKFVARHISDLKGKNLACWCPLPAGGHPDVCHGAVLLALANGVESGLGPLTITRIS